MKTAPQLIIGYCLGTIAWLVILALLLASIGIAFSDETDTIVLTRPAPERSLNYEPIERVEPEVVYIYLEQTHTHSTPNCDNTSNYLKVELIAKSIAETPELGYLYTDTLELLHTLWCAK